MVNEKPAVIVTGSSGLIGYAVCDLLAKAGYRVQGFDRPGSRRPTPSVRSIPCDLTSDRSVSEALENVRRDSGGRVASGPAADSDHLAGAFVVTWAVIAFGDIARPARVLNIPMGLWLVLTPWLLSGDTELSRWNDVLVGIALIGLSIRRGRITARFGGWNRYLI